MDNKENVFQILLITAACIAFCAVLFLSFGAVKDLSAGYRELVNADLTENYSGSIHYDDHMYAVLGKGVVMDDTVSAADRPAMMTSFLEEALFYIDERIFAAGILYSMMISAIVLYPLSKKKPVFSCLAAPVIYVLYLVFEVLAHAVFSVPFYCLNGQAS